MRKNSTIDEKKLQEITKKIYIDELIGKIDVSNHQELVSELDRLLTIATEYLLTVLSKQHPPSNIKAELIEQIKLIDNIATSSIHNYKRSLIYFNENGELLVDTI